MKIEQRQPESAPDAPMATSPEIATPEEEVEELLDVGYVAAKLKVCKATVYKMVKEGAIEAVHLNRLVRITPKGYKQLLEKTSGKGR